MNLQSLKEETRDKFWSEFGADYIYHVEVDEFIESLVDSTYHATKEEVWGIVEEEILAYEIENSRSTAGTPYNYGLQGGLSALQGILAALEDTTTKPSN